MLDPLNNQPRLGMVPLITSLNLLFFILYHLSWIIVD